MAGLGIRASEDSGVVTVALEGPSAAGRIVSLTAEDVAGDDNNSAEVDSAATTEAQAGIAELDLQINEQLTVGDEIELTLNNGTNNTTITLVVGEKGAGNTSGEEIAGTNNKFVLDYEDVVQDGTKTPKTTSEVAQVIADVLLGAKTFSSATIDTDAQTALNEAFGTSVDFADNFSVQAVGDSVRITDIAVDADEATNLGQLVGFDGNAVTGTSLNFDALLDLVTEAEAHLNSVTAQLGAAESALESQDTFMEALVNAVESGIGTLVDANMAEESAKFQALQVQQQLGLQALSIANQQPQSILALFR